MITEARYNEIDNIIRKHWDRFDAMHRDLREAGADFEEYGMGAVAVGLNQFLHRSHKADLDAAGVTSDELEAYESHQFCEREAADDRRNEVR